MIRQGPAAARAATPTATEAAQTEAAPGEAAKPAASEPERELAEVIEHVAHLLPAQGPITVFIHHNTLHAFEELAFEEAVVRASELFDTEPFLPELSYRAEFARGRIARADVDATLAASLGAAATERIVGNVTRTQLRASVALYGIPDLQADALAWTLSETDALERFRDDVPPDARERIAAARGDLGLDPEASTHAGNADERALVRALWLACNEAVDQLGPPSRHAAPPTRIRHRDRILAACGVDIDDSIHPVLIRFVSAFLDQGLAQWVMVGRERGLYACFLDTFATDLAGLCGAWSGSLAGSIAAERASQRTALGSVEASLLELGVTEPEWEEFLSATGLALRGFAGMVRQIEERPDRVPAHAVPVTLTEFLAIRLLLERAAITHVARSQLGFSGPLAQLRAELDAREQDPRRSARRARQPLEQAVDAQAEPSRAERAWPLFQLAQLLGLDGTAIASLEPDQLAALERELFEFHGLARRELLHLAYERHLRQRYYDALLQHTPSPTPEAPLFQAIFCIDDREESIRRHIEELEPRAETFGLAGFYGIAMYFRGAGDAHPRPLCPVVITPKHFVGERLIAADSRRARLWALERRAKALVDKNIHVGSRTLLRGALVMAALGTLALVPLVLQVVFPWLRPRVAQRLDPELGTQLELDRTSSVPPLGEWHGYTVDEQVQIVRAQLETIGLFGQPGRFAPLVFSFGHGSQSLNNPHASAYDCGACGGGRGGPNGRAFAQMANDPEVRARLADLGRPIPATTWFVGGARNTTDSSIRLFDLERVPATHQAALAHATAVFEHARRRDAHERSRRFELARLGWSSHAALRHVEARAADLAQPRAECGHATNALCFVGRRSRVRGLFLDRRAFLTSYDPSKDPEGKTLAGLLAAVVPVVAGINLEYYFSYVDPRRYGCGTKLPHNVVGLLGVMDGAQSDLRTGLPWQMVEIHEPVRVAFTVEAAPAVLAKVIADNPAVNRLVRNRWLFLSCLDPDGARLWEYDGSGFVEQASEHPLALARGSSRIVYQGKRGHLPFTRVAAPERPEESSP